MMPSPEEFSTSILLVLSAASAGAIWLAGIKLSNTTDVIAARFGLGEALGGVILLAIATNLPEIAITATAAWHGNLGIAIGNILGGIAMQTVVLVLLDVCMKERVSLTYKAASLVLVLEATLVIAVLIVAIMASRLPSTIILFRVAPGGVLIACLWGLGLWLISKARGGLPWHEGGSAPDTQRRRDEQRQIENPPGSQNITTTRAVVLFTVAAAVTLVAGIVVEQCGEQIATRIGMSGVLFGATVLAAVTALPEVSTGIASVRLGDYELAVSDIFGGNAFLPVLFVLATLVSGEAALPQAKDTDIYLAGLGILLTAVYIVGLIFRPQRLVMGMGLDSLAALVLYGLGVAGLIAMALVPP